MTRQTKQYLYWASFPFMATTLSILGVGIAILGEFPRMHPFLDRVVDIIFKPIDAWIDFVERDDSDESREGPQ